MVLGFCIPSMLVRDTPRHSQLYARGLTLCLLMAFQEIHVCVVSSVTSSHYQDLWINPPSYLEIPPRAHALGLIRKEVAVPLERHLLECDRQTTLVWEVLITSQQRVEGRNGKVIQKLCQKHRDIEDLVTIVGSCPVHCRMLSSLPGMYPLGASSTLLPVWTTRYVSRH